MNPRAHASRHCAICHGTRGGGGLGTDFDCDGGTVAMCLNAKGGGGRIDAESETFIAHALRAEGFDASEDGTGHGTPLVPVVCPTLRAGGNSTGGDRPPGTDVDTCESLVPVAIQAGALRENPNSGPDGVGVQEHIAYTLEARAEVQAVECANTLNGNSGRMQIEATYIPDRMAVRRLTPVECLRLQGFPDNYLDLPGAADGPKYRAIGNSMAVPVMAWIGRRIQEIGTKQEKPR